MSVLTMPKRKGRPGPKPDPSKARTATAMIRATVAYREWLDELAEFKRTTVSDLIDDALVAYARSEGFTKLPPKR